MKRNFIFVVVNLLCIAGFAYAFPGATFTQYGAEEGLYQKTIQYFMQDRKGLMWFTTWDGLYKFDGYRFKNYKARPGDDIELRNNRMESLLEDHYGYIWIQSYDQKVYRFDPNTERFQSMPYTNYVAQTIRLMSDGTVWILTAQNRLLCAATRPETHELEVYDFFRSHRIPFSGRVNGLFEDKRGDQWILTEKGLYRVSAVSGKKQVHAYFADSVSSRPRAFYDAAEEEGVLYFSSTQGTVWQLKEGRFVPFSVPTASSVRFVRTLAPGKLFVGTEDDGFFTCEPESGRHVHYCTKNCKDLKDDRLKELYIDSHHGVWMRLNKPGITYFQPEKGQVSYFILQDRQGKDITEARTEMNVHEDIHGNTWVHPSGGGLARYDREANKLEPFFNSALQSGWSSSNRVHAFSDRQGNLWISSYGNGLEKVTFGTNRFRLIAPNPDDAEYVGNNMRGLFQDRDGHVWMGSKDKIIRVYDAELNFLGCLTSQGEVSRQKAEELGMAYAFVQDSEGTLWIGTKGGGLIAARPQAGPLRFRLERYVSDKDDPYSLSGDEVYSLYIDRRNRLWIATFGGGIDCLDLKEAARSPRFVHSRNVLKRYPINVCYRTRFITGDAKDRIWVGSTMGLLMCPNPDCPAEEMEFLHYNRIRGDASSLSNNDVHGIFFTKSGDMYVATFGGGLDKLLPDDSGGVRFRSYTRENGLPSDILLSIEEDARGNLWMTTEEELCRFNPETERAIVYSSKSFPGRLHFNEGAALRTKSGQLLFNTIQGVLCFHPDSISYSRYVPPILFTSFLQKEEAAGKEKGKTRIQHVDKASSVRLPHDRNGFTIEFAALDMKYPNRIRYAYRLKGFEKSWNYIGHQRTATYTNLPKGDYVLEVKSTNSDGIWVENTRSLEIVVLPSFWETPGAYVLYVLGIAMLVWVVSYILFTIFRLKHKVKMEQEISDIKLEFFTNISHELRTPLTLIAGPVEEILRNGKLAPPERQQLVLVKRNADRMSRLVNQILDFRKIQNKKTKLRVQQVDLVPFAGHVMENFRSLADEQDIDFRLECDLASLVVWADADKLEKILFNLLSNAFKYTPKGKVITVGVRENEKEAVLCVEDQGIGIAKNKQKTIFARFESLADKNLLGSPSTGIGLSLVKELTEMHGGTIGVESRPGKGSRFTVRLPKGKAHYDASTEFILSDSLVTDAGSHPVDDMLRWPEGAEECPQDAGKETLLIVEDNAELRCFLRSVLSSRFRIVEAENGRVGLEKSRELLPDIIISDVMMPEMDGIRLTQILRKEIATSHIPIILLTAKSAVESRIEGLEVGADDYLTKPFSASYLEARLSNLIAQRKKLQAYYCSGLLSAADVSDCPGFTPLDREFMDKLVQSVEKHLDNSELKVEDLASEMNMSRSVFFKKLKTLTGLSPIEFLREMRMKHAARLIETGTYNMLEIAYKVGFSDNHYFSKCFKQQYGITPTEYKKQAEQKKAHVQGGGNSCDCLPQSGL